MNNSDNRRKNTSDTGKIPLSQIERELLEQRRREQYENIIKRQNHSLNQNQHNETKPTEQRKAKAKKKSGCSRGILSLVLIFAILCATLLGCIYYFSSQMQYEKNTKDISDIVNSVDSINDNLYNLLLIGTDKEDDGKSRSDTMILVTIDDTNKKIKLTSFMRDLWVSIPGYDNGRLNSAFTIGGAPLLMKTISENFEIRIDNYMLVDFDMFQKLIDSFGGITVDITEKEAAFINRTTHAKVTAGENTLNGDYALIYCRIRKLDSDFMRTQRQRKVMNAIFEKATNQDILTTVKAATNILPLIKTDINPMKMTYLIMTTVSKSEYPISQCRVPFDNSYSNKTINGQAVLVPDISENCKKLNEFITE